jgi:hypothetical protein
MPEFLVVNPHQRRSKRRNSSRAKSRAARTKSNPAGVLLSMANPKRKRPAKGKKNPAGKIVHRYQVKAAKVKARRRNPAHKKNPLTIAGLDWEHVGIISVGAFGGAMLTRKLTSLALGKTGHNDGFVGYLTNGGVALGLGLLGGHFVGPVFGSGVVAGGVGTIWQRFYDEHIGMLHKAVATAVGGPADGKGMGDISYDEPAVLTLEGYYESRFTPETEIVGEIHGGAGPIAMPGVPALHKMIA